MHYIPEADVHIDVRDVHERPRPRDPASSVTPAVVVDTVAAPIEVVVEPGPDEEGLSERDARVESAPAEVNDRGVVDGHIDVLRLGRPDLDIAAVIDHFLLRRRGQIAGGLRFHSQPLNRRHDIGGLIRIGLPEGGGPIQLVRHHGDDGRIVGHGFDADVPGLLVYQIGIAVCARDAGGFVDLVRESRSQQHLRE